MIEKLLIKFDYFMLRNYTYLPYRFWDRFDFPTKRLVKYCFSKSSLTHIKRRIDMVAHMYAYDSTVTKDNLDLINNVHYCGSVTRERIRQVLCKFIRTWYNK